MKKLFLYPLWLRIWHWFNASLFLLLIVSGISLHYSATSNLFIPFDVSMVIHNIAGITISAIFLIYTILNIKSGNYKFYIPKIKNFVQRATLQTRYYVYGVFKGEPHPFGIDENNKFNPLQQLTYFGIMFFMMPAIIISGWLLMFPEIAPKQIFGMGGVWPMALLHIVSGFFLSLFMFGHIYLATHGDTVKSNFESMITGYHIEHDEHDIKSGKNDPKFDHKKNYKPID